MTPSDYDAWLERPYTDAARAQEEVEKFAEARDLPLDTDEDWQNAEELMESEAAAAADDYHERRPLHALRRLPDGP